MRLMMMFPTNHLEFRHVDSAQAYRNESAVGEAVRDSGVNRSECFISACHCEDDSGDGLLFLPKFSDEMRQQESWIRQHIEGRR
jgi:hypothetical protein